MMRRPHLSVLLWSVARCWRPRGLVCRKCFISEQRLTHSWASSINRRERACCCEENQTTIHSLLQPRSPSTLRALSPPPHPSHSLPCGTSFTPSAVRLHPFFAEPASRPPPGPNHLSCSDKVSLPDSAYSGTFRQEPPNSTQLQCHNAPAKPQSRHVNHMC